ncbi:YhcB family protein [Spartinivicinus poritis]|uniref:Z-ring associated protein G n=1 Tax=Spartinivicinus poritis TaxID=2994640 RepID=A0ABT5U9S7_9GAMM|nr:YhcB family protein [Spartinivicinus sp. A2-2]MDE1462766.1 YhcB family protein [Spartinivicinus sp. A2-2]
METANLIWFILGVMVGASLLYMFNLMTSNNSKSNKLENQLQQTQNELNSYHESVNEHFNQTRELVNKLTETYKDLNQHIANSAATLCDIETQQGANDALLATDALVSGKKPEADERHDAIEPPKDYAPKKHPTEKGTLSEDFGVIRRENPSLS